MKVKTNYTYVQKYLFNYFTQLGYSFFHKQEIILIPKKITYNPKIDNILYNQTHTFTKEELCLILEKYFCCVHILRYTAPLTKYLHLNFIYLKDKNPEYYKIKINYVLATPKIQKTVNSSILHNTDALYDSKKRIDSVHSRIWRLFGVYKGTTLMATRLKKIKINKFLHIIKKTKFQRTHQFFNFLKNTKKELLLWVNKNPYNYPQSIKSAITAYGFCGQYHETYEEIIENFDYLEITKAHHHLTCVPTLKILTLNLFKIIKINNDFDLFYFLFYNYMILNNIYITEDAKLFKILQNDTNTQNFMTAVKKLHCASPPSIAFNSILIPAIPIEEISLGNIDWLFENLHSILNVMCDLLPFDLDKTTILSKFSIIFYHHRLNDLKYFLKIKKLPTKQTILTKKEYSETSAVYNWTTCLVVYLLKINNQHTLLPKIYEQMKFFEIDLEQLLIYTNIYSENLYNKYYSEGTDKTLESKKFSDELKYLFF